MRVIGKALPGGATEYSFDGWRLAFGPSIGNRGMMYIALENPRGWESLGWVETRAQVFAWVDKRVTHYRSVFG